MNLRILSIVILLLPGLSLAQGRYKSRQAEKPSKLSWDLSAAFGSYNGYSYSEIDAGLNYRFLEPWNWRNVIWDRIGNAPIATAGLDSSIRYEFSDGASSGNGFRIFAGPGVRIASTQFSGPFVEVGAVVRLGGLNIGGGVKIINYSAPGRDPVTGAVMPNQDTIIFIVLAGGGAI